MVCEREESFKAHYHGPDDAISKALSHTSTRLCGIQRCIERMHKYISPPAQCPVQCESEYISAMLQFTGRSQ